MKKIIFLLVWPVFLNAQNNIPLFDKYMQAQTDLYNFNGNVLIAKNGNVIYKKSFGYADYNTKQRLFSTSIFDIGSIAKEFTAVGILILKDKGKISYTDTLGKFFPELPYTNITVQQLLTHTSGMPEGFKLIEKFFDHNKIAENSDLIKLLAKEKPPLLFKPGSDMMYSGTAFNVLASLIEKISGQPYREYMNENIFKPLGMKYTQVANYIRSANKNPGLANGYVYSDSIKKYVAAESLHTGWTSYFSGISGEGMIITTSGDLLIWDRALKNNTLLTKTTQHQMVSLQAQKKNFPTISFGYGIRVGKNDVGDYVFHNGYFPGYKTMHMRYTGGDITAIVLSNNESQSEFIADALIAIALHKKIEMPYHHQEGSADTPLSKYVGRYMIPLTRPPYMVDFPVEIVVKNDNLYIKGSGREIELKPETLTKFFYADGTDQQLEFEKDITGNTTKVWHIAWGVKKEVKKIE